jgi:hypothetical protein
MIYDENYTPLEWIDHVVDGDGNVIQQGTVISKKKMERIESGVQTALGSSGILAFQTLQFVQKLNQEFEKMEKQKIMQGEVTVTADNYTAVALDGFVQYDAPDYQVVTELVSGDPGFVGSIKVEDKTSNGFKVRFTGSEDEATIKWTLINFDVK